MKSKNLNIRKIQRGSSVILCLMFFFIVVQNPILAQDSEQKTNQEETIGTILCHNSSSNSEPERVNDYVRIVYEIIETSEMFLRKTGGHKIMQRIESNGGYYYDLILWSCPYDKKENSSSSMKYRFDLHEVYKDRYPKVASFTFDLEGQDLFISEWNYELAKEGLISIPFNRKLLSKFNQIGK
ncbi:hypothetical protein [Nafulsella turpanensis]|uniref:hypothetical protein n=1 Tax=Nafulsella turpanensis TaxID=1265690 RepID=UPI001267E841|nr:hypothetical protein [Nafulsella turpanensis]